MRRKPHPKENGFRIWMNGDELDQLIETMEARRGTVGAVAGRLGGHTGLRRAEAASTCAVHVQDTAGDAVLRVPEGKDDKYRETPIPADLADRIRMIPEYDAAIDIDDAVLDVTPKTLNRWVKRAAEQLASETGDPGWTDVTYHDLRRTWGTRCLEEGMLPSVVMWHGGWDDWDTFRQHYLGEFSPGALKRERRKVPWLADGAAVEDSQIVARTPAPTTANPTTTHQTD